jgi:hypothetical protein
MDHERCRRIFDLTAAPYKGWPFVFVGAAFLVIGLALAWKLRSHRSIVQWTFLAFALTVVFVQVSGAFRLMKLREAVRKGQYESLKGVITDYRAVGAQQKGNESFVVEGHRFEFSDSSVDPGFSATRRSGGSLAQGTVVCLAYQDGAILLLDICDEQSGQNADPIQKSR